MDAARPRLRRQLSLTQRLALSLGVGAVFVAMLLGFLSANREDQARATSDAEADAVLAASLAERAAPLLERSDLMRLSVLATVARDQVQGRVLVLDRGGKVVIDTALVLGERQLGLLASSGAIQRTNVHEDGGAGDLALQRETLVPVRYGGDVIGELRVQRDATREPAVFDFTWFGLVLLCSLTLVVVAVMMGYHWSARIRSATDSLLRLSAGEQGVGEAPPTNASELQDLSRALVEMERGVHDGLTQVADGFVALAQRLVEGLERHRLVPPGHGARTEQLAQRLVERLQLLPADCADLAVACRLVDLGKAWVRPAALQKQGQLTAAEAESVRQHPVRAAAALECMPPLRRVARILRHQSERYDGAGTPDGLRGDRIPLGARVLAIAAAFDLMTTCAEERPMTWQQALRELDRCKGEVFDPWLVELFVEEIQKSPPAAVGDRAVMIVPAGAMPWGEQRLTAEDGADEADEDYGVDADLEVLADDDRGEER